MTDIRRDGIFGMTADAAAAEAVVRFAAAAGAVTRSPLVVADDGTPAARVLARAAAAAVCSRGCPVLTAGTLHSGAVRDLLGRRDLGGALLTGSPAPGRIGITRLEADGRNADDAGMAALWDAYDNGSDPGSPAVWTPLPTGPVIADYLKTLTSCVDIAAIRAAAAGCAIDFGGGAAGALADAAAEICGMRLLRFRNGGTAAAQAAVQLGLHAAFAIAPAGDAVRIGSGDGDWLAAESGFAMAVHHRCRCAGGGDIAVSGGNGLLVEETIRRAGGRCVPPEGNNEFYGADGAFAFGGAAGFDAYRMILLLLEAVAVHRRPLAEQIHHLPPLHLVETALPWHGINPDRITALRGRLGDARLSLHGDTCRFEDADGRLSFRPDPAAGTLMICAAARRLNDARERLTAARQLLGGER